MATTITSKGQVTIPKRVRDALRLAPGDSVDFAVNPTGQVVLQKAAPRSAGQTRSIRVGARQGASQMAHRRADGAIAR